jgi:hypothetical protein
VKNGLARRRVVVEGGERGGHGAKKARVNVDEGEAKRGRHADGGPRDLDVLERPGDERVPKLVGEGCERRAFRPREQEHDARAVCQAKLQQIARQHVVPRIPCEETHVPHLAQGLHLVPRPRAEIGGERRGDGGGEELLLAFEVPVDVPRRHARPRRDGPDRRPGVPIGGEGARRRVDDPRPHLFLGPLCHQK